MAIRGVSITVNYTAWDTNANAPKTGDVANHTLRVVKDGTAAAPTNAASEIDATFCKGEYKLTLTAAEMTADTVTVCGSSSTAGIVIIPYKVTTEHGVLPTVQQGNVGAVMISGANVGPLSITNGVTITNPNGDALTINSIGSNGNGVEISGNGSGKGLWIQGGTTGHGATFLGGATSGSGIVINANAGNFDGIAISGSGTGSGLSLNPGVTGAGLKIKGGATSGPGINVTTSSGDALQLLPAAGSGIVATGQGTNTFGAIFTGGTAGVSDGVKCVAGFGGVDLRANITGNLTGNVTGSVATVTAGVTLTAGERTTLSGVIMSDVSDTVGADVVAIKAKTDQLTFSGSNVFAITEAYAAGQDPATLVLDTAASGHNTAGTIGAKINAAATAGADPWLTALPGAYAAGTAGFILGNGLADVETGVSFHSAQQHMAAVLCGSLVEASDHTTTAIAGIGVATPRISSINTNTTRTVTLL